MGRKKKYNYKGIIRTVPYNCFEFEEKIPINCWSCHFHGSLCNNNGTLTNRFCLKYVPSLKDKDVRELLNYIPRNDIFDMFFDWWQNE